MTAYLLQGMHGLGDNLHQRALVRALMGQGHDLWLETPWPSVYHDLVGDRLHLVNRRSRLRTQARNALREAHLYSRRRPPVAALRRPVSYSPALVRGRGSILAAMLAGWPVDPAEADFRLPVPEAWRARVRDIVAAAGGRPILVLRPLVERTEWGGCAARNPHFAHYAALYRAIRDRFHVVSVADLAPRREWLVGPRLEADRELHRGELVFEELAALVAQAALVFGAPGFATILAQAVGTASVTVYGGYEDARSFSAGARFAPWLPIEPIVPVCDFRHDTTHDKSIDLAAALPRLQEFAHAAADRPRAA